MILSKIMSTARANLAALSIMALLFLGIVIGDAARETPGTYFSLGRMDGHNPTVAYGANTHSDSGDMNKGENSIAGHSSERKLGTTTDGARFETLSWYCSYIGKKCL
ncbi:Os04g0188433 [Oryza sativa Japonica Group]|uniref:Os04g0188433 protein n=4 Tax=Oryza sativa TaxID=4530 RepID=A0A8J8XMU7_ORYSJ|nr:hypothetical protein OsJ_13942 [Oryza sativa Japonica Group]KAB8094911.1 hypothetical protein EE612_022370 [Oryza sativa]KAF2932886.1 hypothetical protein DAI22_04g033800 [Oryza sativa Japonica Group]BAH00940.1 unnamed protein product [Oryza sativa Japonica Group]BAH92504.1 Os04g0188433 [Oryza sativa Japonica Group]|eukprot:NP_001173776.1 Os04g0188433 [Oryza sativa Japonica Group]